MSEQSIRTRFDLSQTELDTIKNELRNIHDSNNLQSLTDTTLTQAQCRDLRLNHLRKAIKEGKLTGKIAEQWADKTAQESLHWLLRNLKYKQTRRHRHTMAIPKSLQSSSLSPPLHSENPVTKTAIGSAINQQLLRPLQSEKPITKTAIVSTTTPQLSLLPSSHRSSETRTETRLSTTETPSPISNQLVLSCDHGVKRSFWFVNNNSRPRSPAATALYRIFLVTKNIITEKIWPVMVSDLPSCGIDGSLSYADWSKWIQLLTEHCQFDNKTQQIQTSDAVFTITNYSVWQTVILMSLEDMAPLGDQHITGCLKIHFNIVACALEIQNPAIPVGVNDLAIDSTNLSEGEESDTPSTNTRPPKRLCSTTVEENPTDTLPVFNSENSSIPTIPTPRQHLSVPPSVDVAREIRNDSISIHSSSVDEDRNIQHDIVDVEDPNSDINRVITRDKIATEEDLKQDELGASAAIHKATKKCEQFSDERWKNFQTFFMLPKEGNDGTDPDIPIPFPGLDRCPFPHQLYGAFIMIMKQDGPGGGGYLGDQMGVGKTMTTFMYWILNVWLLENYRSVERARSQPEQHALQHLPENASEDTPCPSQSAWPFLCRCVNSPFSAKQFAPKEGATLVIAPKSLLLAWAQQWSATIPNGQNKKNCMKFKLLIGHGDITRRVLDKIDHPDIHLIADQQDHIQAKEDLTSGSNDHRYMVITTPLSFESKVHPHTDRPKPDTRRNFYDDDRIDARLKWGAIIRDEFHSEKGFASSSIRVFRQLTLRQNESLLTTWLLSGTMFDKGPIDLLHWMNVLETEEWAKHPLLKEATEEPYKGLSNQVQKLVNKPSPLLQSEKKEMEDLATKFSSILEQLAICRAAESTWFGKPVIKLPPHTHHDVVCNIPEDYRSYFNKYEENVVHDTKLKYWKSLEAWKRKTSDPKPEMSVKTFFKQSRILRIAAIFPAILPLAQQLELQLTDDEFKKNKWNSNSNPAPYFKILDKLIQSSSKCKVVERVLGEMANSTDFEGREEKLVIITYHPVVLRILAKVSKAPS